MLRPYPRDLSIKRARKGLLEIKIFDFLKVDLRFKFIPIRVNKSCRLKVKKVLQVISKTSCSHQRYKNTNPCQLRCEMKYILKRSKKACQVFLLRKLTCNPLRKCNSWRFRNKSEKIFFFGKNSLKCVSNKDDFKLRFPQKRLKG